MQEYLITIRRREFTDNVARKTYERTFYGDYQDAVAYAKSLIVYKDEYFTVKPI